MRLRIGTRGSRLALVQSNVIAAPLRALGVEVELVPIRTAGDRLAQVALADFGGKALFVKEIEEALLERRVDLAVHSLKDMPAVLPDGLVLGAFPEREDPRDALVTRRGGTLEELASKSVVGTSSLRRKVLVLGAAAGSRSSSRSGAMSTPASPSSRTGRTTRSSSRRRA